MPPKIKPTAAKSSKMPAKKMPAFKIPSKTTPVTGGIGKNNKTFSATRKTTMKLVPAAYQKADDARGINAGDLTGNYYLRGNCDSKWNKALQEAAAPHCLAGQTLKLNMHAEPKHLSLKV